MLAAVLILLMTAATIAVIAHYLAPRMAPGRIVYDPAPDKPHAFGYRMSWLAVRTRDTQRLLEVLGIGEAQYANWNNGLGTVYSPQYAETHLFVSPPVNGWSFVVGLPLPHPLGGAFADKATPLLLDLGRHFVEVQYYFCYPVIDYYAWARVLDGRLIRAFAMSDVGVLWNRGKPTKEEKALGLQFTEQRSGRGKRAAPGDELVLTPTENQVIGLAARWSLDPTRLDQVPVEPALGIIGRAPLHWRAERLRRAA